MSKLLYTEPKSSFFRRKYWGSMPFILAIGLITFVVILTITVPNGGAWEKFQRFSLLFLVAIIFIPLILFSAVLPALLATRFEVHDDKIVLPFPRKINRRTLLGVSTGEVITKDRVRRASLDFLKEGGAYATRIPGKPDAGQKGEWRCVFLLENGELFVLEWSDVRCKEDCVPALAEFIKGLEDDLSPYFL